jgi:hypothetical protein
VIKSAIKPAIEEIAIIIANFLLIFLVKKLTKKGKRPIKIKKV